MTPAWPALSPLAAETARHASTPAMKAWLTVLVVAALVGVVLLVRERRGVRALVATAAVIVVASAAWLRINRPIEGGVLAVLTKRHGITVADIIAVPCLGIAVGLIVVARRLRAGTAHAAGPDQAPPRMSADTRES